MNSITTCPCVMSFRPEGNRLERRTMRERELDRYVENLERIVLRKERQIKKLKSGARLSDLSRCMAHGMATPFRALKQDIEKLLDNRPAPIRPGSGAAGEPRDRHDRLRERLSTCCRLLDGMLDNLIAGSWTPSETDGTIDVNRVIEGLVDQLRDHGNDHAGKVVLRLDRYLPEIGIRECDCYLVVHNLLMNALESVAGDENGRTIVSTARRGDHVIVDISDNGEGVPEEIADNIFKPHISTKWMPGDRFRHPGLGLYTASRIVEQSGGRIEFASAPGETQFTVLLPVRGERAGADSRREGARGMETKTAGLASAGAEDEGITGIVG